MFQLVEVILSSPLGSLIFTALRDTVYAVIIVADCEECGFNDLGKLLFGGLVVAVVVGVAASLLWRRRKEDGARASDFISIRSSGRDR